MKLLLLFSIAIAAHAECGETFISSTTFFKTFTQFDGSLLFNEGVDLIPVYGPSCDTSLYVTQPEPPIVPPVIIIDNPPSNPQTPEQPANTPEPANLGMMIVSLAILFGWLERKRRNAIRDQKQDRQG